jgi:hypothetical protein
MMNTNHPDDELLAAFAGADAEATGDPVVSRHLASCDRCAATVAELRSLAMALGELPDLAPHRPLRFLPPVGEPRPSFADRLGGVVRGIFAPALTAGAALALIGAVGTFGPSMLPSAQSDGAAFQEDAAMNADESAAAAAGAEPGSEATEERSQPAPSASDPDGDGYVAADASSEATPMTLGQGRLSPGTDEAGDHAAAASPAAGDEAMPLTGLSDRPIWPMLLFSGLALIVLVLMLRWILAPRAG